MYIWFLQYFYSPSEEGLIEEYEMVNAEQERGDENIIRPVEF